MEPGSPLSYKRQIYPFPPTPGQPISDTVPLLDIDQHLSEADQECRREGYRDELEFGGAKWGRGSHKSAISRRSSRYSMILLVLAAPLVLTYLGYNHYMRQSMNGLQFYGGLAYIDESKARIHPILNLIEAAKIRNKRINQVKSAAETLEGAIRDYRHEFGLNPPEGFEAWFEFAQSVKSTSAPSLIPFAHTSILPYLALPAEILQSRALATQRERGVFGMIFHHHNNSMTYSNEDDVVGYMSPRQDYPILLQPIVHLIPPPQQMDRPVQISACVKDGSCRLTAGTIMEQSRHLASLGNVWDIQALEKLETQSREPRGCKPRHLSGRSLVEDMSEYMDFCLHEDLVNIVRVHSSVKGVHMREMNWLILQNGEMIMENEHIMRPLAPMLAVSRLMHGADIMGVPTRAVNDTHDHESWEEKTRNKVVWRGTNTGVFHRDRWDWRSGQRYRLSRLGMGVQPGPIGQFEGRMNDSSLEVLIQDQRGKLASRTYDLGHMAQHWLDVGVIDKDMNNLCGIGPTGEACRIDGDAELEKHYPCEGKDNACEEMHSELNFVKSMSNADALPYKYRMDIDGYGWSSRFRKVMSSNTLIMKSTVYPEWWTAIPWYHFVPMKYDYSDIFDILAFFDSPPDAQNLVPEGGGGQDYLAEMIAMQGREFALNQMRWEDMQSYMLLLLLEVGAMSRAKQSQYGLKSAVFKRAC